MTMWSAVFNTQSSPDVTIAMGARVKRPGGELIGDQTGGVEAEWEIVEPLLDLATPVYEYEPRTWGPPEAERLSAGTCGCDSLVELLPNGKRS